MYKYMCVYLRTYICLYVFVRISPSVQVFYSGSNSHLQAYRDISAL